MHSSGKPEEAYYISCDIFGPKFCRCKYGNLAFKKWIRNEEVQKAIKKSRGKQIKKAMQFAHLPTRWQEENIDDLENTFAKELFHRYMKNFRKLKAKGQGIFLWGKGMEKTRLSAIFCQEIIRKYNIYPTFISEGQMISAIKKSFNGHKSQNQNNSLYLTECKISFHRQFCIRFQDKFMEAGRANRFDRISI